VIQEREIQRVGSEEVLSVNVRILAATNRNLEIEVQEGNFREDLYYRLNVVALRVPSLRERQDDVPPLAQHFLDRFAEKNRKPVKGFSPLAMEMLLKYDWPGNVRELENTIERAVILMTGDHITEKQLPPNIVNHDPAAREHAGAAPAEGLPVGRPLEEVERAVVLATLESTGGNKSETARILGITRKTLHNKLKRYDRE
jgi:two-component system response regulator HydG